MPVVWTIGFALVDSPVTPMWPKEPTWSLYVQWVIQNIRQFFVIRSCHHTSLHTLIFSHVPQFPLQQHFGLPVDNKHLLITSWQTVKHQKRNIDQSQKHHVSKCGTVPWATMIEWQNRVHRSNTLSDGYNTVLRCKLKEGWSAVKWCSGGLCGIWNLWDSLKQLMKTHTYTKTHQTAFRSWLNGRAQLQHNHLEIKNIFCPSQSKKNQKDSILSKCKLGDQTEYTVLLLSHRTTLYLPNIAFYMAKYE